MFKMLSVGFLSAVVSFYTPAHATENVGGKNAQTFGCQKASCGSLVQFPGYIDKMPVQVWCKSRQTEQYVQATNMRMSPPAHTNCDYGPASSGPNGLWLEMKCASHVVEMETGSVSWDCPSLN